MLYVISGDVSAQFVWHSKFVLSRSNLVCLVLVLMWFDVLSNLMIVLSIWFIGYFNLKRDDYFKL